MLVETLLKPKLDRIIGPKVAGLDNVLCIVEPNHVGIEPLFSFDRFAFCNTQKNLRIRGYLLRRFQRANSLCSVDDLKILSPEMSCLLVELDRGANCRDAVIEIKEFIWMLLCRRRNIFVDALPTKERANINCKNPLAFRAVQVN